MGGKSAMANSAALPAEGLLCDKVANRRLRRRGRSSEDDQSAKLDQMIDELCAFIEADGGEMRADRIAQFYQCKPPQYRQYFMREGLRNVVSKHEDRLTWDGKDFIRTVNRGLPGQTLPKKSSKDSSTPNTGGSQLIHLGAHCVVRKHSTMGCAVVGFGNEQLVGCILGKGPFLHINQTKVHISSHVDTNAGTGFVACSLFAAWGPQAEAMAPVSAQLLSTFIDGMVLSFISGPLATTMSNPALAAVRSLVHYIAATNPADRAISVAKVDDFNKFNPEYKSIIHRRVKLLCECYPEWLFWLQVSPKECVVGLGPQAIVAEFGEPNEDEMLNTYSGDRAFDGPWPVVACSL